MNTLLGMNYIQYLGEHPEDITLDIVFASLVLLGLFGLYNSHQSRKLLSSLSTHNQILGSQIQTLADLTPPPDAIDLEIQNRLVLLQSAVNNQDQQLIALLELLEESTVEDIMKT